MSGVGLVYHSLTFPCRIHTGKSTFIMKIKNVKLTIAAFEAQQIKTAQQLEVKGGDGGTTAIIGDEDVIFG